jgi:hypothetical protein
VVGLLFLYIGLLSTEAYYVAFGIRYQFLGLTSFHIVYRGLTVVRDAPYLLVPYALAVLWLTFYDAFASRYWPRLAELRIATTFLLSFALLVGSYPLAVAAGRHQARTDMATQTTGLPSVTEMNGAPILETVRPEDQYRLLLSDGDYVYLIETVPLNDVRKEAQPIITRIAKGDIHVLRTGH